MQIGYPSWLSLDRTSFHTSSDSRIQFTNIDAVCIKACDINNDCIYGGLSNQYDTVVAYNADNLCIGYSGCIGCPTSKKMFMRGHAIGGIGRRRVVIDEDGDKIVRKVI